MGEISFGDVGIRAKKGRSRSLVVRHGGLARDDNAERSELRTGRRLACLPAGRLRPYKDKFNGAIAKKAASLKAGAT
jgi:hypothetical protein